MNGGNAPSGLSPVHHNAGTVEHRNVSPAEPVVYWRLLVRIEKTQIGNRIAVLHVFTSGSEILRKNPIQKNEYEKFDREVLKPVYGNQSSADQKNFEAYLFVNSRGYIVMGKLPITANDEDERDMIQMIKSIRMKFDRKGTGKCRQ